MRQLQKRTREVEARAQGRAVLDALSKRPDESAISEGNLAENPLFVLTNKEARPLTADGKVRLSDYTRVLEISKDVVDGALQERSLTLKANPQFGYPTMFAYRLLLAVLEEAGRHKFASPVVYISRYELAQKLGYKKPSKANYQDIHNALEALRSLTITFRNTWHDRGQSSRNGDYTSDGLVASFSFRDERQASLPFDDKRAEDTEKRSYVKLADLLYTSVRQNYLHGIDLNYMNALRSPLAQRLYAYLTKKDNAKRTYCEGLKLLAAKLNLKNRSPFHIKKALEPALELLRSDTLAEGHKRRFLEDFWFDNERQTVTVSFFRPVREVARGDVDRPENAHAQAPWGPRD